MFPKLLTEKDKQKNVNLEAIRVLGCLFVILIHFSETMAWNEFQNIITLIPRIGVPLFFFLGGATLYRSTHFGIKISVIRFFRLLFPILFFMGVYFSQEKKGTYFTFLETGYPHLWYLYAILPIHSLACVLRPPKIETKADALQSAIIAFSCIFLFSTLSFSPFNLVFPSSLHNIYGFDVVICMMVLGYALSFIKVQQRSAQMMILGYCLLNTLYVSKWVGVHDYDFSHYHFEFTYWIILFMAILCFIGLNNIRIPDLLAQPIMLLGKYTLHMYGWHVYWVLFLGLDFNTLHPFVGYVMVVLLSFFSAIVTTSLFSFAGNTAIAICTRRAGNARLS